MVCVLRKTRAQIRTIREYRMTPEDAREQQARDQEADRIGPNPEPTDRTERQEQA